MQVLDVQQQIKSKKLDNLYIFTGTELEVQRIYINKLIEVLALTVFRCDNVSQVASKLTQKSFLTGDCIYLIYNDYDFIKNENSWQKLENIIGNDIIILVYADIDKRSKFYKHYSDKIVVFDTMADEVLMKYIEKQIPLSVENCQKLIDACENNYSRILLEIDKIKHFGGTDYDSIFNELWQSKAIYIAPKDAIFDLCDNICKGYIDTSFELWEDCKAIEENPLAIITVLYNNIKQMLQVQSYDGDYKDIYNLTGLTSWQVKQAKERIGAYSIGELVYFMKLLHKVETGIKTGEIEQEYAIDYILVNML